jgi:hypothetical protein
MKIKNAIIEDVSLGFECHGILSSYITVSYGGSGQGFGGYAFGGDYTDYWIRGVLKALDLEDWSKMKGTSVRVKVDGDGNFGGKIVAIGHIIKDQWFYAEKDAQQKDGE